MVEFFVKIVNGYHYIRKRLHRRCLTGYKIRLYRRRRSGIFTISVERRKLRREGIPAILLMKTRRYDCHFVLPKQFIR